MVIIMYQSILFKAPGRCSNSPIVILNALSLRQSLTLGSRLSRTLSMAWQWLKCRCTPGRLITSACAICAVTAFFAGLESAVTRSEEAHLLLAISTAVGLPLAIIGAFITSTSGKEVKNVRI